MSEEKLLRLLKVSGGEQLSEDNDPIASSLVWDDELLVWDDDAQTHKVTMRGRDAINRAVAAVAES